MAVLQLQYIIHKKCMPEGIRFVYSMPCLLFPFLSIIPNDRKNFKSEAGFYFVFVSFSISLYSCALGMPRSRAAALMASILRMPVFRYICTCASKSLG